METFSVLKRVHGNYISQSIIESPKEGHYLISAEINSIPLNNVVLSVASFFTYINREEAIKLELKSHPSLMVSHDLSHNQQGMAYISLANVNILGTQQQVLVRITSLENLNIFGNDLRKVFDLHLHKKCFSIRDNPQLYKKDYQIFGRLLKQNNLSILDLIPIKDLDYI